MTARAHRHRSSGPGAADAGPALPPARRRIRADNRLPLILFAFALVAALGAVLILIGTGTGQAGPAAPAIVEKENGLVGIAAVASVLVSVVGGAAFLHRQLTSRRR